VTYFVTPAVTVFKYLIWEKLSVYEQIVTKKPKKEMAIKHNFYSNIHLTDALPMEFMVQ